MIKETIEDAAKKHALKMWGTYVDETHKDLFTETLGDITIKDFTDGAKSDAAKNYWYEQFKREI